MVANLGMDRIGEIERSGPHAEVEHLALGGEDVDLLVVQLDLERMQKLLRILDLVARGPIETALEGVDLVIQALGAGVLASARTARAFVEPMRGDAIFGLLVHLVRANLNLERTGRGTDDRGVQALVVVGLGHVDVILEAPGHGRPQGVRGAERGIAIDDALGDHAQSDQVVDLGELLAFALHLLIDRPVVLGAARDLIALDTGALQLVVECLDGLGQEALAGLAALAHHTGDALVRLGLEVEERQILELPLDGAHAQAVGERRVNVHGLARLEQAAIGGQRRQGTHVVQSVGELDDDHADVAAHREEHLAQVERLLAVHGIDVDVGELGHAVHKIGDSRAEERRDVRERGGGVLDRVVQQCRANYVADHLELGQDDGHLYRMVDVGLAATALLRAMLLGGETVRLLDKGAILLPHVLAHQ